MSYQIERAFRIGSILALVFFVGSCAMVYRSTKRLVEINHLVEHSQEVLEKLEAFQSALDEAVSSTRNYVLAGDEKNLSRYASAKASMTQLSDSLHSLTIDNPVQQRWLRMIGPALSSSYDYWGEAMEKRRMGQKDAADALMSSTIALQLMRDNREGIVGMIKEENNLLGIRSREAEASAHRAIFIELLLAVATLAILVSAYLFVGMDLSQKAKALQAQQESEKKLRVALNQLNTGLRESEARSLENSALSGMADLFQSCHSVEEACKVSASALPRMLDSRPGALCIISSSRNVVETVAMWNSASTEQVFTPEDCWALRRGKTHIVTSEGTTPRCAHVKDPSATGYLCVPLASQGETLGVLYVENKPAGQQLDETGQWEALERIATAAGDRISLALGNLNLREILRNQSIRDPLTGLFNRRYMEESLSRELHRAARNQRNVALVMLDVDHFKDFNDTFGHQSGDALLRELGGTLKSRVRAGDIACRYGGEEFALILSETDVDGALKCMEHIQAEVKQYRLQLRGQALRAVTLSAGIAVFPDHADSTEGLVRAADLALYRAKAEGRNRVLVSSSLTEAKI